jgi:hypothetical protein
MIFNRRRKRHVPKTTDIALEVQNGLPSLETLNERERQRRSNSYVDNLQPRQSRQLPLPPNEDEDGYMTPQKPDVTSPLLEEQHSEAKYIITNCLLIYSLFVF